MLETMTAIAPDTRMQAVRARDASADGRFVYAVVTTGVFCRPSCGARPPKPENMRFYAGPEEARAAGFRPCLRCKPEQPLGSARAEMIATACRQIETAESEPTLEQLAGQAALSPFHFHRVFKAVTGLTPKGYARAHRNRRVRAELLGEGRVTDALYDAGFNSNGRFYEVSNAILGMTPTRFRNGGDGTEVRFAVAATSLGAMLVAESDKGICSVALGDEPDTLVRELQDRFPKAQLIGGDEAFERRVAEVVGLIDHPEKGVDLPLDIRGTAFQQKVWAALRRIPAGQTLSYAELAQRIGDPKAVRAVAGACAANTLALLVPCHRIVRTDGAISGYRWGAERKRVLLQREAGR
jgi:AraC family transcriptional regulator, regulatory protein of adaptative response / methylated-DNA-[protein]-cysteine methyltransferase